MHHLGLVLIWLNHSENCDDDRSWFEMWSHHEDHTASLAAQLLEIRVQITCHKRCSTNRSIHASLKKNVTNNIYCGEIAEIKKIKNSKAYSCCRFCLICPMISAIRSSCQRPWVQGKRWWKHGELPTPHFSRSLSQPFPSLSITVNDTVFYEIAESALSHDTAVHVQNISSRQWWRAGIHRATSNPFHGK